MNHNPDMNDLDNWLAFWVNRSLDHMKRHRSNKKFTMVQVHLSFYNEGETAESRQFRPMITPTLSQPVIPIPTHTNEFDGLVSQSMIDQMVKKMEEV